MKKELIQKLKDRARSGVSTSIQIKRNQFLEFLREYEELKEIYANLEFLQDEVKRLTVKNMILTKL